MGASFRDVEAAFSDDMWAVYPYGSPPPLEAIHNRIFPVAVVPLGKTGRLAGARRLMDVKIIFNQMRATRPYVLDDGADNELSIDEVAAEALVVLREMQPTVLPDEDDIVYTYNDEVQKKLFVTITITLRIPL